MGTWTYREPGSTSCLTRRLTSLVTCSSIASKRRSPGDGNNEYRVPVLESTPAYLGHAQQKYKKSLGTRTERPNGSPGL